MKMIIKAHSISITKALKAHAESKLQRLERFFDAIQEIVVDLDISGSSKDSEQHVASATIFASGTIIRAEEASSSMYASIDVLIDKLESQLKKHKEKLRDHKRSSVPRSSDTPSSKVVLSNATEPRYVAKPMDPEDAILILEKDNLSFLAFRDLHERVCVIYPLGGDQFGLIET